MLTLFYFIICSKGNYCFVELLFQLCVCIVTSNVFSTVSFGQRVHETVDCRARERGFDSVGHLSLPLSRLMTLRNCVCVGVFLKPHQHTLPLLVPLGDVSSIFHSSTQKIMIAYSLYNPPLLILCVPTLHVFLASLKSSFSPQTCLSSTQGPRLQFCPSYITRVLGFHDAHREARHSPDWQ